MNPYTPSSNIVLILIYLLFIAHTHTHTVLGSQITSYCELLMYLDYFFK